MTEFPQIVGLDEPLGLEPSQDPAAPLPDLHNALTVNFYVVTNVNSLNT